MIISVFYLYEVEMIFVAKGQSKTGVFVILNKGILLWRLVGAI